MAPNLGNFLNGDVQECGARIGGDEAKARKRWHGVQGLAGTL